MDIESTSGEGRRRLAGITEDLIKKGISSRRTLAMVLSQALGKTVRYNDSRDTHILYVNCFFLSLLPF